MGSKCGPSIANMYISILEKKWLNIYKPLIYKRFIDDIFILSNNKLELTSLNNSFKNLKLNTIQDEEVQFLDLLISNDNYSNKIKFKLYIKSTNTFQYLYSSSNHPEYIFRNIPKSLFIRIRRICSEYIDYLYYSRKLIFQLLKRGYNLTYLIKICLTIGNESRDNLIPYKNRELSSKLFCKNNFKYIINFDINYIDLKKDFNSISNKLKKDFNWVSDFKFSALYSSFSNFNNIFINNSQITSQDKKHLYTKNYNVLDKLDTFIYQFLYNKNYIRIKSFNIPLYNVIDLDISNIVYILICKKCNMFYIGQSGRKFKIRFLEHIKSIKNFLNLIKFNNEVSTHFNKKRHDYLSDLKFCIFKKDIYNLSDRLSIETDLINIFLTLKLNLINSKLPDIKYINKLAFSF